MCIRDSFSRVLRPGVVVVSQPVPSQDQILDRVKRVVFFHAVSYTHLRAHETVLDLVCRLLLEKQKHQ